MTKKSLLHEDALQKLVKKYLNDECSPQEIETLNNWYNSFDKHQDPIEGLTAEQVQQLKERLMSRIRKNIAAGSHSAPAPLRRNPGPAKLVYLITGIAAMALLVMGIFLSRNEQTIPALKSASANTVISNTSKSIRRVALEDGSIVWLNPDSKIEYPEKFTAASRELRMQGEAFFEVKPDLKRPFIIYSNDMVTRVWGTSFLVRATEGIAGEVSVVTGKVSVRLHQQDDKSAIMLMPDEKVTFIKAANVLKKEGEAKNSAVRIWQKTTLSFDNIPLKEVLSTLNKKFGVDISTEDKALLSYSLKADFTDQSLPAILEMLEKSLDLKYEINERKIILND